MGFLNLAMLFALAAAAIPVLIHLLHRRRYEVVDWGAMQFLRISETRRRSLLLHEILLLCVRIGLIVLLVLGLARPVADASLLGQFGDAPRLTVLIIDGSYSMGFQGQKSSPFEKAKAWIGKFLDKRQSGDKAAIIVAFDQPMVVAPPTGDAALLLRSLDKLPQPHGTCNWPQVVQRTEELYKDFSNVDILVLRDGQRFGWADDESLTRWKQAATSQDKRRVFVIDTEEPNGEPQPNYALSPLTTAHKLTWPGQEVRFRSSLIAVPPPNALKRKIRPVHRAYFAVDGKPIADLELTDLRQVENVPPRLPLSFTHRFDRPGVHKVSLIIEPDLPAAQRPGDYRLRDALPGDDRQELAMNVVQTFPILLLDGAAQLSAASSTFFLLTALTGESAAGRPALVAARAIPSRGFSEADIASARVLVLADVPHLTSTQEQTIRRFVENGGGLLVVAGARLEGAAARYNSMHWLPARLDQVMGNAGRPEPSARIDPTRLQHPALDVLAAQKNSTLAQARFPRWWKTSPAHDGRGVAFLNNGDPFLSERELGKGRILLCTVPLDRTWGSNFPSVWEYPVLLHELAAYLAAASKADDDQGIDIRESDLTPLTDEERARVAELGGIRYGREAPAKTDGVSQPLDVYWLFLIGVTGFLCVELWLTRRMAVSR